MRSRVASRLRVAVLASVISIFGSITTYGWLLAWHSWATKWYLLTAFAMAAAVGLAVAASSPRRRVSVAAWLVAAAAVGLVVAPWVGMVVVYKIGGSSD